MVPDHDGGRGENGAQLPGSECFQGAQAVVEFARAQATLAAEAAQKIFGSRFSLLRVAFDAAGNQIAVGIAAAAGCGDDVVEAARRGSELAQAIEAEAAVSRMNGLAAAFPIHEIHLL